MKRLFLLITLSSMVLAWGRTGHFTTGQIAEDNLSRKAKKAIVEILGHSDLAYVSTWADDIKSDDSWDHAYTWHWTTIPEGAEYDADKSDGQAAAKIDEFIAVLSSGTASREEQQVALKFLVHLVGDIHQPLHVGNGTDRGGNAVKVTWFGKSTNLHRVWDSQMIESRQMSYSEWATVLQKIYQAEKQNEMAAFSSTLDILKESQGYHESVYDIGDGDLGYRYIYDHIGEVEERLLIAGLRLAKILNDIYA